MALLLRADLLPEAWIAPPPVRQLRALLRHRVALVRLRTLLRNRIHAIVADYGHDRPVGEYWSGPGRAWLASLDLPAVSRELVEDDLGLIGALQDRIDRLDWEVRQRARSDPRVKVLTQLPGVGPFTALVLLAEIGEVSRFGSARKLASWAGLTPTIRGSDRVAHYGHIFKEGSVWLRFSSALAVSGCMGVAFHWRSRRAGGAVVVPPLRLLSDARAGHGCGARHMDGLGLRCLAGERRLGGSPSAARTGMPARAVGG